MEKIDVKSLREVLNITQQELAEKISAKLTDVQKWEDGRTIPAVYYVPLRDLAISIGLSPERHVYLLERRAIVKVAGQEMIHSDYSGFAGVFDSEKAAMSFAEAVTESLTRSSGRTFTLEAAEKKGERQRFVFRQAEKTLYPVFRFTCTREEVCGRI